MSDIVRVSVNSTVKTVAVAVNQTTKVVMVDVQTSVASLVVQRRTVADGSPVDGVTTADYLGQQCIVGNANGPFTVYTASQVSPSKWTTVTPASLGLLIGTNILAYRTFGTAANNNTGDFAPAAGSSSILTLGTVTTGTWGASVIAGQYGGTGVSNTGKSITLGGNLSTSSQIAFSCSGSLAFVGPTTGCTFTLPSSSAWLARTDAAQTFAGVQTFSSVPVFSALTRTSVYLASAQTMIVSTYDTVKFDTVEFGSGFNTGTNSYTVPYTGYLKVTGAIGVQSGATGGYFVVTVYRNGTQVKRCFSNVGYMFGSISPISVIIPVTAADAITIRVYSSPAATLFANSTDTWCQFEMLPN